MPVGPGPGVSVVVRARVGTRDSLGTMEAKGTAVGFVAKRVKVTLGVDDVLPVAVGLAELEIEEPDVIEPDVTEPEGDEVGLDPDCNLGLEGA